MIADCPVLRCKQQAQNPKSVALLKTVLLSCIDVLHTSYKPFVMTGFVSLSDKDEDRREISILGDTGAMVSIMVSDILPFACLILWLKCFGPWDQNASSACPFTSCASRLYTGVRICESGSSYFTSCERSNFHFGKRFSWR